MAASALHYCNAAVLAGLGILAWRRRAARRKAAAAAFDAKWAAAGGHHDDLIYLGSLDGPPPGSGGGGAATATATAPAWAGTPSMLVAAAPAAATESQPSESGWAGGVPAWHAAMPAGTAASPGAAAVAGAAGAAAGAMLARAAPSGSPGSAFATPQVYALDRPSAATPQASGALPADYSPSGRHALLGGHGCSARSGSRRSPALPLMPAALPMPCCSAASPHLAGWSSFEDRSPSMLAQRGTAEDPLITYIRSQVLWSRHTWRRTARRQQPACCGQLQRRPTCLPAWPPLAPLQLESMPAQPAGASGASTPLSGAHTPSSGRRTAGTAALWSIGFNELNIIQPIGLGSFGRVYRAEW